MEGQYARQVVIPEIGEEGQQRLGRASVLVIGAGGLGSPALFYLAAAGVGHLGVVDYDDVALSNLNRQILYTPADVGESKAQRATARLQMLNPDIKVTAYEQRILSATSGDLVRQYDLVIEASDNLETKDLVNELCVAAEVPLVWGAVQRFEGQMGVVLPGHSCRRCMLPPAPEHYPDPAALGVLGATAGVIGTLQAMEAIKVLLGIGKTLVDALLLWNGRFQTFDIVEFERNPTCPICGEAEA